jgi:hypothetical protein
MDQPDPCGDRIRDEYAPMTPLPRTTPILPRLRRQGDVPMSSAQYLRWRARRKKATPIMSRVTTEEAAAAIDKLQGYPYWRDVVEAAGPGTVEDEVDAGFLAAVRLEPRVVGTAAGQVPMEVARRLYEAGLVRKVDSQAN